MATIQIDNYGRFTLDVVPLKDGRVRISDETVSRSIPEAALRLLLRGRVRAARMGEAFAPNTTHRIESDLRAAVNGLVVGMNETSDVVATVSGSVVFVAHVVYAATGADAPRDADEGGTLNRHGLAALEAEERARRALGGRWASRTVRQALVEGDENSVELHRIRRVGYTLEDVQREQARLARL